MAEVAERRQADVTRLFEYHDGDTLHLSRSAASVLTFFRFLYHLSLLRN